MADQAKRNFKAIASDVSDGFITINPIFLKPFDANTLKTLYSALERKQKELRAEPFPYNDLVLIRKRNLKLQRLYSSLTVVKNFAREKRFKLAI
jgi:hypothetical protein